MCTPGWSYVVHQHCGLPDDFIRREGRNMPWIAFRPFQVRTQIAPSLHERFAEGLSEGLYGLEGLGYAPLRFQRRRQRGGIGRSLGYAGTHMRTSHAGGVTDKSNVAEGDPAWDHVVDRLQERALDPAYQCREIRGKQGGGVLVQ